LAAPLTPSTLSKDEILQNHRSILDTFNIPVNGMNEFELHVPYLYWIPKLRKMLTNIDKLLDLASAPPSLYLCSSPTY
jgi:hypothetical protein